MSLLNSTKDTGPTGVNSEMRNLESFSGPACYIIWRLYSGVDSNYHIQEFPIFSDAYITGSVEEGFGPFSFHNTCPMYPTYGRIQPALVLRIKWDPRSIFDTTNTKLLFQYMQIRNRYFYPGSTSDELSALLSLALGVRLRSGKMIRHFYSPSDRYGTPYFPRYEPSFLFDAYMLPRLPEKTGPASITEAELLKTLPKLTAKQALDLVRAARLYQDALWLAEAEPELSWLFLVRAIEAAAADSEDISDPIEVLRQGKPDLYNALSRNGRILEQEAKDFAERSGAMRKFREFSLRYLPRPPEKRPDPSVQISWDERNLKKEFNAIYEHRSKALHAGVPFPNYLCQPPIRHESWAAPEEIKSSMCKEHATMSLRDSNTLCAPPYGDG